MDVVELFKGVAVIIDDQIDNKDSEIYKIKEMIMEKKIPVLTFSEIPDEEYISSFQGVSFIIIDWDFNNDTSLLESERVIKSIELSKYNEEKLIHFLTKLRDDIFVPVYIFSGKVKEEIQNTLRNANLWDESGNNRIFIKQKNEIRTANDLFNSIEKWTREMSSVYVLKEWNSNIEKTKNVMFNELFSYSPDWASIILDLVKSDGKEFKQEFGDFLTRNLISRRENFEFEEDIINTERNIKDEELRKVLEGERFMKYDSMPEQAYTGDLINKDGYYYLNITAQCSISRKDNPKLLCIKGKKNDLKDILVEDIHFSKDKKLIVGSKEYTIEQIIKDYIKPDVKDDEEDLKRLNKKISKYQEYTRFRNGTFLERDNTIIITCVNGEKAIEFDKSDYKIFEYTECSESRVGRILPPYITMIQQKSAAYLVREGTFPIPSELLKTI